MRFQLEIICDNTAFDDSPEEEVSRILRELSTRVWNGAAPDDGLVFDTNGNSVGTWRFGHE